MIHRIYPQDPSLDDKKVFDLMKSLQWIKPKHLEIKAQDINEQMWKLAIQGIIIYIYIYRIK